ncbi:MAG: helix-turn-helix domain-containing protein [Eubacteriales bacterium]|nr:helix-turn-helix domain-containing protein [Eubacteriales bacterium]
MTEHSENQENLLIKQISDMLTAREEYPESSQSLLESDFNDSFVNQVFQTLNNRHTTLYQFVMKYSDYIYSEHNYGNEQFLTMVESHTLTYIEDHPGITVTELSAYWKKTKGYISQIVSKLEKKGFISKEKENGNAKSIHLYITDYGLELSHAHKLYDVLDITKTISQLQKECTYAEIDTFYKVLFIYYQIICKDFEDNQVTKRQKKRLSRKRQSRK